MNPNNWLTFNGYKLFPHLYGKGVKISRERSVQQIGT